jgi:hypothetical protein
MFRVKGTTVYGGQHFYLGEFEDLIQKGSSSVEILTMRGILNKNLKRKCRVNFALIMQRKVFLLMNLKCKRVEGTNVDLPSVD